MSFPLPYVLVLLTYPVVPPSCPVRLPAVSSFAACPFCLLAFVSSRLSFRLSTRRAKRLAMCVRRLLAITTVVRMSCGCRAAAGSSVRLLLVRLSPRFSTREAGRGTDAVVACFFRISTVCCSRWRRGLTCLLVPTSSVGFLLRCAIFVDRVRCGCRGCFAMVYCHCVVREDEHGIGSSGFLSLVFLTRFPLRLTPTSSLVSTLIAV